ncbi:MAG: hypothetical protein OHK0015_06690 [Chloroflexi bacterium OHK40]
MLMRLLPAAPAVLDGVLAGKPCHLCALPVRVELGAHHTSRRAAGKHWASAQRNRLPQRQATKQPQQAAEAVERTMGG